MTNNDERSLSSWLDNSPYQEKEKMNSRIVFKYFKPNSKEN